MPELPEVETTRRGVGPHLEGRRIAAVVVRQAMLRWPIPDSLTSDLPGQTIRAVRRRAKYLLIDSDTGSLMIHLGMSGHLRILRADTPAGKHDHFDLVLADGHCLRLNDPRRFGAVLWNAVGQSHPLLARLAPEPLESDFNGAYLQRMSKDKTCAIKALIMDSHVVVGVGNIYASEALALAGIHPARPAGRIAKARLMTLTEAIKQVLNDAIAQGGTTLRDFRASDGKPGYFKQALRVYGRADQPCLVCATPIRQVRQGQRSTYYCPHCQR